MILSIKPSGISTWAWLSDLSGQAGQRGVPADVPLLDLERLASCGFDGIWLMGV